MTRTKGDGPMYRPGTTAVAAGPAGFESESAPEPGRSGVSAVASAVPAPRPGGSEGRPQPGGSESRPQPGGSESRPQPGGDPGGVQHRGPSVHGGPGTVLRRVPG